MEVGRAGGPFCPGLRGGVGRKMRVGGGRQWTGESQPWKVLGDSVGPHSFFIQAQKILSEPPLRATPKSQKRHAVRELRQLEILMSQFNLDSCLTRRIPGPTPESLMQQMVVA